MIGYLAKFLEVAVRIDVEGSRTGWERVALTGISGTQYPQREQHQRKCFYHADVMERAGVSHDSSSHRYCNAAQFVICKIQRCVVSLGERALSGMAMRRLFHVPQGFNVRKNPLRLIALRR